MPPRLLIFDDYESLSRVAAEMLVFYGRNAITQRGQFSLVLSGGSTPQRLFEFLAQSDYAEQLSWPQAHLFWGDERCVPPDQPGSNYKQAFDAFLGRVPVPPTNIHRIRGELSPQTAAEDYAQQLREFATPDKPSAVKTADQSGVPQFDLVLLGMGNDGHTASLFPGPITEQELTEFVIPVTAHYEDRPANRVSLTPLVFNAARQIFFLATGASKAEALHTVLNGPLDPERYPAQRIYPTHGQVTWFVDREAARLEH